MDSGACTYVVLNRNPKYKFFKWFLAALFQLPFAIVLYFSYSSDFNVSTHQSAEPVSVGISVILRHKHTAEGSVFHTNEKCDLFRGDWIPQPSGPYYTNESCRAIQEQQNCMKNGRPDSGYLYWRWKPDGCDLPRFDGSRFLQRVRNTVWGFIGDSIARNHAQSLVCLLSQVENPTDIYHDDAYKFRRWYFPSYNFTLVVLWSRFLVKETEEQIEGVPSGKIRLYLDTLDENWMSEFHEFDFVVFSGGKWFLKPSIYLENNEVVGCHNCPRMNITELGFYFAYRKALGLAFKFMNTSPNYRGLTFFRTFVPDHFENGQWLSGGTCARTLPFKKGEITMKNIYETMRKIELEEFQKAVKEGFSRGLRFKLLDTTLASLLRADGHPGPYMNYYPFANDYIKNVKMNDCLHWCLPGPIDTWSELLLEMMG